MTKFHLFESFPEDIRRLIFEIAFDEGYPGTNHLSVLSREINSWIQPLVYRCITLQTLDHDDENRFLRFIDMFRYGSRGKDFYANSIKVVCIDDFTFQDFALHFLPSCRYLVSLSCRPNPRSWSAPLGGKTPEDAIISILKPEVFPYLRKLSIPKLQSGPLHAFNPFISPLAQNLTHLDFLLGSELSWEGLKYMNCLQYLSIQPVMDTWLPSSYIEGGMQLESLADCVIPFLPSNLHCFLIWLSATMVANVAQEDTRRKLQNQTPIFASLVHGWLDSRIILASSISMKPDSDPGMPDYFRAEVQDFMDQTVLVVNGNFDSRLIWDNPAGQGGDQVFWGIERILYRRQQAALRARDSHWHPMNGHELRSRINLRPPVLADFSLFNKFPEDIRRLIFEIAFETSQADSSYLALVSRETHSWVEPLIYRRIALCCDSTSRRFNSFVDTVCHGRKEKCFYANLIQSLSIDAGVLDHLGKGFLSLCENVLSYSGSWTNLDSDPWWDDVLQSILKCEILPRIQKLSLRDIVLPDIFTHPVCQSLTHLDICLDSSTPWDCFKTLLRLKHIRIDALKGMPIRDDPIEASRDVREFIQSAVFNFPPSLETFVFCVDPTFALFAATRDCELKILRGGPTIFADIARGGIDHRVVLSCKASPLVNWSDQRVSQRQVDEIYNFLNQLVPYSCSLLPWDSDNFSVSGREVEFDWLDAVKNIIRQRKDASHHANHEGD